MTHPKEHTKRLLVQIAQTALYQKQLIMITVYRVITTLFSACSTTTFFGLKAAPTK